MKKYILVISLVLLAGLMFFYTPNKSKKRELLKELTELDCDLNQSPCEVDFNGKKVIFDINPKPLKILKDTKITIKNLDYVENLNAKLYGLNMYMGDIVSEFEYLDGVYNADIVFSSCIEAVMRYRFELFNKDKSLGLYIDFDVKR